MGLKERIVKNAEQRSESLKEAERELRESAEVEYNEDGLVKRKGFRMGQTVNYGEEFEEESMNRVFKSAVIFLVFFFILFMIGAIAVYFAISSTNFEPFLFKMLFD